jgi:hypothetical protein
LSCGGDSKGHWNKQEAAERSDFPSGKFWRAIRPGAANFYTQRLLASREPKYPECNQPLVTSASLAPEKFLKRNITGVKPGTTLALEPANTIEIKFIERNLYENL